MTLNITVLTEHTIFQSADFRLTSLAGATKTIVSDVSTKLVVLQYGAWDGLVSYTGIGRWDGRDTAEYVLEWLTGLDASGPSAVAARLRDAGTEWLKRIEARTGRQRQTFILAAFDHGRPQVSVVSNFEDCYGQERPPDAHLTIHSESFAGSSRVVVTGQKRAVLRPERRRLEHLLQKKPGDPARVRRMLAELNARAASGESRETISENCSVFSFRADGRGVGDIQGPVEIRTIVNGVAAPDLKQLKKLLGFDPGHIIGTTFASSSRASVPFAPCLPRVIVPDATSGYGLYELTHSELTSCVARAVSARRERRRACAGRR